MSYSEAEVAERIADVLAGEHSDEFDVRGSLEERGYLTRDAGFVVEIPDSGERFIVTVQAAS